MHLQNSKTQLSNPTIPILYTKYNCKKHLFFVLLKGLSKSQNPFFKKKKNIIFKRLNLTKI
jgi:hypothetical protein